MPTIDHAAAGTENQPFVPQEPAALPRRIPDATDHGGASSANYVKALDGSGPEAADGSGENRRGLLGRIAGFGRQAAGLVESSQTDSRNRGSDADTTQSAAEIERTKVARRR